MNVVHRHNICIPDFDNTTRLASHFCLLSNDSQQAPCRGAIEPKQGYQQSGFERCARRLTGIKKIERALFQETVPMKLFLSQGQWLVRDSAVLKN